MLTVLNRPVTREHFYWLCKAICTRVWKRTINHTSSPVRWPNAVHLITIDETDEENKKLPCLAVSMLWSDSETDSEVRASIQTTIEASQRFQKPYDQHLIFVSSRYPSIFSPSSPATLTGADRPQVRRDAGEVHPTCGAAQDSKLAVIFSSRAKKGYAPFLFSASWKSAITPSMCTEFAARTVSRVLAAS